MEARKVVRPAISVVLLGATILGAMNVFGDNAEVRRLAQIEVCGKPDCAVKMTREEKNPFQQSFTFQIDLESQRTRDVACRRAQWLIGAYSCTSRP